MTSPLTYLRQIHGNLKWFNEKWFWSRRWKNYESFCQESRRRFLSDAACFLKSKGLVAHESDLDELKNRWGEHVAVLFDSRHSQEFYRNWTGAVGASNLIANIWDQCSRSYLVFALAKYANGITGQVLDYGCGTASISLSWQRTYAPASQLLLADVENLARQT